VRIGYDLLGLLGPAGRGLPVLLGESKVKQFIFYSDPGHGWLQVPRALLHDLGIEGKVSAYSYQRIDDVFLEEDCDYSLFAKAMKEAGIQFDVTEVNEARSDSWVRSLPHYQVEEMVK
jgi:hypothetical protein